MRLLFVFPGKLDVLSLAVLIFLLNGKGNELVVFSVMGFAILRVLLAVLLDDQFFSITVERFYLELLFFILALFFLWAYGESITNRQLIFCTYVSVSIGLEIIFVLSKAFLTRVGKDYE